MSMTARPCGLQSADEMKTTQIMGLPAAQDISRAAGKPRK
jgi:hypothetical protein